MKITPRELLLTVLVLASGSVASIAFVDRERILIDPPPRPSGGSGVEVGPPGLPRWVELDDFIYGDAPPPLLRSDAETPFAKSLGSPPPPPRVAFDAITSTGVLIPPDTHIAVGPLLESSGRVMMVTNEQVAIWDKLGNLVAGPISLNAFFGTGSPQPRAFDPKVLYDQHSGRFFVVALQGTTPNPGGTNNIHIAVSSSGAPNNLLSPEWTFSVGSGHTIVGGINTWADYPGIGADNLALFITANLFDADGVFRGIKIRVLNKTQLMAGNYVFTDFTSDVAIRPDVFTVQPAHVYGTTTNGGFYLISRAGPAAYRLFHITGHPAAPVLTTNTFAWVAGVTPVDDGADQCTVADPDIDTLSTRIQNAIYRDGRIWCTMAADPDGDEQVEVVWQVIADNAYPIGTPAVSQSGFINGTGFAPWTYMPSINVNAAGDAVIVYTQSSATECPNIYYAARMFTDPAGTFQTPVLVRSSAGFYDSSLASNPDRWGDYAATVIDPEDDSFWIAQEFAFTSVVGSSLWGTHIASIETDCNNNGVYDPLDITGGTSEDLNINGIPDECEEGPIDVVFFESTFGAGEWTTHIIGCGEGGNVTTLPVQSAQDCDGPLGSYMRVTTFVNAAPGITRVYGFQRRIGYTYTPMTQGAIVSIDYSECNKDINENCTGGCQATGPAIRQNGNIYSVSVGVIGADGAWDSLSQTGIVAEDFRLVTDAFCTDANQHPDFSSTGSTIEVGFFRFTGSSGSSLERDGAIDNWSFIIHVACSGDISGDGSVNVTDLLGLLAAWGTNPGGPPDFNSDGSVNVTDLLTLLAAWGACP